MPHHTTQQNTLCAMCDDGDGQCVYPYYGIAPHIQTGGEAPAFGATHLLPRATWGTNFREDTSHPGTGTYLRCPYCGAGEPMEQTA